MEVAKKLSGAIKARQDGLPLPSDQQTFAQFVTKWVEAVSPTLRTKTAYNYAALLDHHAVPIIGKIPITKLQPAGLIRVYEQRRKAGAAPRSILHLHRAIFGALRFAERWGDVTRNVAALVDAPKVRRSEMHALSGEEARSLLQVVQGDRLEAFLILALSTGMRLGELLGLTWASWSTWIGEQ
jgi:integrase